MISVTTVGLAQQISVRRIVHPNPVALPVSSDGTIHCAGTPGPEVYMNTTQNNTTYQMWQDLQTDVLISTQPGNGGYVNFGETNDGTMYVFATNTITGCTNTMANTITISSLATPILDITANAPTTGCGTVTVTLSTPYQTGCTYQWSSNTQGNIPGATSNTYVASVTNATKVFTCTATNANDCESSDFIVITSNPYPTQFAVSTTTPTFCPGEGVVTIAGTTSGGNIMYHLSFGGNVINTITGNGAAYSWTGLSQTGTYTVTAENVETGCELVMGSVYLSANPLPAAAGTITGPTDVCQNATVTYSTGAITNASTYTWSVPTWTTIVSGQGTSQITLLVNTAGVSGNITVMGQNACGGGAISSIAINVMAAPTVNTTATPGNICAGNSTTINAGGNGTSFVWSGGMTTQSAVVYPTGNTTYNVTVTGSNGCTTSGNVSVTVHQLPTVTLTLPETNFCQNDQPITVSGGSPAGGTYTGNCIFNNQFIPSSTQPGGYTVTYTYEDGYGCSGIASQDVVFNQAVLPVFLNIPGPIYINTPGFYLTGYVSPSGGTFEGPGVVGNMFNPAVAGPGTHMITYTYIHPITGCSGEQIQWIVVSSGNDPGNSVESVAAANAVAIYPNPASEILNLSGINTQEIISLQVIDITGRIIYENGNLDEDIQINLNNFLPGNYIIRFFDRDGMSVSKKFMKN